ncbi:serine/threonine protein phosphatase 1 [Modicisalibacter muralis]|uniref:Serine/threonine protein phosphatase 1 n=1 Tax=Modicisalibacter muralis TaxID=119000 RepID=A0A1G9RYC7_9GAMM|nr:metallophosphoesterase [Halomonas muralis]SDM28037.1 serine/threonine protein phosphatase 1 [Halomonas muralis]
MVKTYAENRSGSDYVVGDIHGCYDQLMQAMRSVGFDQARDRLFSVGDLIDRGPRSLDCLNLVHEPWFHAVRGNHEELARKALLHPSPRGMDSWLMNGGSWFLGEQAGDVRVVLADALERMPYVMEVEVAGSRVGIVHAQPPAAWRDVYTADEAGVQDMLWSRSRIANADETPVSGIDAVVVGHTILEAHKVLGNVVFIDTGAFASKSGGYLTLVSLEEVLAMVK